MLVKLYWSIWSAFALVAFGLFMTGNLTPITVVVLGFVSFGLTFMGMMNVLPLAIAHPNASVQLTDEGAAALSSLPIRNDDFTELPAVRKATQSQTQAPAH
jgi:hypothetical protein